MQNPIVTIEMENGDVIKPGALIKKISELSDKDTIAVTDVGQHQMWAAQFFDVYKPRHFLTSGGQGTMGYGLPAAMGAKVGAPDSKVVLVESPKNALFGALSFQQLTWVAVGNKGMLKREVLLPLRGRDVIVIPDRDAIGEWKDAIDGMADLANFSLSDVCERLAPDDEPKFDIADFILQNLLAMQNSQ